MLKRLPLEGVTVIEMGHSVAAPYAGEILGDLGADVIKIEKADGDDARKWAPPYWGEMSSTFQSLNRNKRSAIVNLKNPTEREALRRLIIERADVVIQNLRPGSAEEFGLDAELLRALKPDLIYCTIGAFGAKGPLKDRPGYDPLMQAFAGMMSVTGEPDQRPVRVGTSIIDMAAGMWAVIGVFSALLQRKNDGSGSTVDTSLYETALGWMCYHAANFQASGELPKRQGSGAAMIVPYRGYATKDGFIVIAAGNDKLFASLAKVLGHPEWIDDPRFLTNPGSCEASGGPVPMDRGHRQGTPEPGVAGHPGCGSGSERADADDCRSARSSSDQGARHDAAEPLGRHQPAGTSDLVRRSAAGLSQRSTGIGRAYGGDIRRGRDRRSPPPSGRDRGGLKSSAVAQAGE